MKEKRLFLALPISADLKEEIASSRSTIKLPLKWIPDENLHVTVLFLGYIPEEEIATVSSVMEAVAARFTFFTLYPDSFIIQKSRFQNMIWVRFQKSQEFDNLVKELSKELGYVSGRKVIPHINLVRSKSKIKASEYPLPLSKENLIKVDHLELWESHLSPKGATYSVVSSFYLKGSS